MKLIDLSHELISNMPVYPGDLPLKIKKTRSIIKDGSQLSEIHMNLHTGTHVDFAAHFFQNKESASSLEPEKFFGRGIVIDCTSTKKIINPEVLDEEKKNIASADFLLFHTGWDKKWDSDGYSIDYPCLSEELANYISGISIKGVGFDTLSADRLFSEDEYVHKTLLGKGKIIIENLTNLGSLKGKKFFFSCFPLKIHNGDGSPVRAIAYVDESLF